MSDESQKPDSQTEPSVLDYLKSLFRFGRGERLQLPDFADEEVKQPSVISDQSTQDASLDAALDKPSAVSGQIETPPPITNYQSPISNSLISTRTAQSLTFFPWRSLCALLLALLGQKLFEPPATAIPLGTAFYIMALSMLGWAIYRGEWTLAPYAETSTDTDPLTYNRLPLIASIPLALWAFISLNDNLFTVSNVVIWCLAVIFFMRAFWIQRAGAPSTFERLTAFLQRDKWTITISRGSLLLLAATALVFFFRFTQTTGVPSEPFSDHAEKILDVYEITQGQTRIFFPRNTGREAFQMYWTLLTSWMFGTGLSFLSLKLGTALLGFLTLPFIYLLGKEIGGPRVALFAFILAGIGYWPNLISRIGLRFPLYPLFVAPTLLYLIRGLRTRNRNDFLLSGFFLGLGLHGYSPMRIVPFVVIAAFVLYWLHAQSKGARKELPVWLTILGLVALFVFLPLLSYWVGHPAEFGYRAFSRLGSIEQPLPGPVYQIFASNVWKALKMFNVDDGDAWVHSVIHRPAFDIVSAALFVFGVVLVLIRYIRHRHWLDLFLLVSIPLLQLPSTLSLAFPGENPSLNRPGGAYIPAFILSAVALDGLLASFGRGKIRSILIWGVTGILLYFSASQNYDLVFRQYYNSFRQGSWNTSDMGKVIREFQQTYGRNDTAWVVPFPYWADTRLPAVWLGIPNRDMAMWTDNLASTLELTGPKLFIVKANVEDPNGNDQVSLDVLKSLYPNGQLRLFDSDVPGHDFWIFFVPNN